MQFLVIATGGATGSVLRFLMGTNIQRLANGWIFPVGTFAVNMTGCLIIGLLAGISESKGIFNSDTRLFLFVGLLGGFTTFSSFGYDTFQLLRDGEFVYAAINACAQVIVGLTCVWLGFTLSKLL